MYARNGSLNYEIGIMDALQLPVVHADSYSVTETFVVRAWWYEIWQDKFGFHLSGTKNYGPRA